jgi:hypothetical protein
VIISEVTTNSCDNEVLNFTKYVSSAIASDSDYYYFCN